MKILKGDTVQVITGKSKGKTGVVLHTIKDKDMVVVDGVNQVQRHIRNKRTRSQGQVVTKLMPLHVSNVALVHDGKPVRVGYEISGSGKDKTKKRVARPSGKAI